MTKIAIVAAALWCALLATPAAAQLVPDLTGTWEGRWSCKTFHGAKGTEENKQSEFQIVQNGTTFAADLDGGGFLYNGAVIPDDKNTANKPGKGEAVLIQCGTDNLPFAGAEAEMLRVSVKTKPNSVAATLKGTSIFEDPPGVVGTCQFSYKRTTTSTTRMVGPCP